MRDSGIAQRLPRLWYRPTLAAALLPLLPLSWLFRLIVGLRRRLYRHGLMRAEELPVPVIVVGNLTVGGSGKTPLVLWLVEQLRQAGKRPGIISRGYKGLAEGAHAVDPTTNALSVGDEPLLLARRSGAPVFVGRDRIAAGRALLAAHQDCDVIVSDDGLQHYRLQRTIEIAVFDGRGAGNGQLLPAGPLREPLQRLHGATAVVWNSTTAAQTGLARQTLDLPQFTMHLTGRRFVSLNDPNRQCTADELRHKRLYAIAGIGDPARFFAQLESMGLRFTARPFPDHHQYAPEDLAFAEDGVLLMTEKDAVKCTAFVSQEAWMLPIDAQLDSTPGGTSLLNLILEKLDGRSPA